MCLLTSTIYHKKDENNVIKCFVAQEDILVYKCLDCDYGQYSTPFRYMPIVFTKGKYVYNEVNMYEIAYCGKYSGAAINVGIHTYSTKAVAMVSKFHYSKLHYAVIPKGSNFYIGIDGDVVSNNLIVYREKRCFDRHYPNIIGFSEYMDKYLK